MRTEKVIDCLRNRYLGSFSVCAECPPELEDCGSCRRLPCHEELANKKQALAALVSGAAVQEVSDGDRRTRYFHSTEALKCLKESIAELEMKCGGAKQISGAYCDPCGGLTPFDTFERARPGPIKINSRRW